MVVLFKSQKMCPNAVQSNDEQKGEGSFAAVPKWCAAEPWGIKAASILCCMNMRCEKTLKRKVTIVLLVYNALIFFRIRNFSELSWRSCRAAARAVPLLISLFCSLDFLLQCPGNLLRGSFLRDLLGCCFLPGCTLAGYETRFQSAWCLHLKQIFIVDNLRFPRTKPPLERLLLVRCLLVFLFDLEICVGCG